MLVSHLAATSAARLPWVLTPAPMPTLVDRYRGAAREVPGFTLAQCKAYWRWQSSAALSLTAEQVQTNDITLPYPPSTTLTFQVTSTGTTYVHLGALDGVCGALRMTFEDATAAALRADPLLQLPEPEAARRPARRPAQPHEQTDEQGPTAGGGAAAHLRQEPAAEGDRDRAHDALALSHDFMLVAARGEHALKLVGGSTAFRIPPTPLRCIDSVDVSNLVEWAEHSDLQGSAFMARLRFEIEKQIRCINRPDQRPSAGSASKRAPRCMVRASACVQ